MHEVDKKLGSDKNMNRKLVYVGMTRASEKLIILDNSNEGYMEEIKTSLGIKK